MYSVNYTSVCAVQYDFPKIIANKTSDKLTDANLSLTLLCHLSLRPDGKAKYSDIRKQWTSRNKSRDFLKSL